MDDAAQAPRAAHPTTARRSRKVSLLGYLLLLLSMPQCPNPETDFKSDRGSSKTEKSNREKVQRGG